METAPIDGDYHGHSIMAMFDLVCHSSLIVTVLNGKPNIVAVPVASYSKKKSIVEVSYTPCLR